MSGNGANHQAKRNQKIYAMWLATHEAARLLDERALSLREIAKKLALPGQKPLTRGRIHQILQDELKRHQKSTAIVPTKGA